MTKTILMIDDEVGAHACLRAVFAYPPPPPPELVFNLVAAMSIEEGLRIIAETPPDVVLLDLTFRNGARHVTPEMTLEILREELADRLPVIVMTGHVDPEDEWGYGRQWKEGRSAGAVGWLRKDRWLDVRHRTFLLHEINDGILEFQVRREMGVVFRGTRRGAS